MKDTEFRIEQAFTRNESLPTMVEDGMQEAYDRIYDGILQEDRSGLKEKAGKEFSERKGAWSILKIAGIFLACFVVMGASAVAVNAILNRYEHMKDMDEETKEQIITEIANSGGMMFQSSRNFTQEELERLQRLQEAYKNNEIAPQKRLARLAEGERYSGAGVCLAVTDRGEENILYLPQSTLTDEELLEIIAYNDEADYVFYEESMKAQFGDKLWKERLEMMTDEEVDYYYWACFAGSRSELQGGFCRGEKNSRTGAKVLSDAEQERYQNMVTAYQEEMRIPAKELCVVEKPEDYDGKGVAYCRWNSLYYIPEQELTEEDCLEMIDFQTRSEYSIKRINEEIQYGYRTTFPTWEDEKKAGEPLKLQEKAFAGTQGRVRPISDAGIGDIVQFGNYEQDGNAGNGKEPISWYVLDETEDGLMLLSVMALDAQKYHDGSQSVSWEECDLRKWLNETFYSNAFSETDRKRMVLKEVENNYGASTEDYVTILSVKEYLEYFGISADLPGADPNQSHYEGIYEFGISKEEKERRLRAFIETIDPRMYAKATPALQVDENGKRRWFLYMDEGNVENLYLETNVDRSDLIGYCSWWLRDVNQDFAEPAAYHTGTNEYWMVIYTNATHGVRPVIWIKK